MDGLVVVIFGLFSVFWVECEVDVLVGVCGCMCE